MKKNLSKLLALLLALVMVVAVFAGCDNDTNTTSDSSSTPVGDSNSESTPDMTEPPVDDGTLAVDAQTDVDPAAYEAESGDLYDANLGEFYALYSEARGEVDDMALRYALFAQAEAKLMESAVMVPTSTQGGMYAINRAAMRTVPSVTWGSDSSRYHDALVATDLIKGEDQLALRNAWMEQNGSGTYEEWAKNYLTEKGYTLTDTYNMAYSTDPATWDVLSTSRTADSDAIVNTYDGLYEYDMENVLQPALATSYDVSEDGTVYTFHLREGVNWVNYQGQVIAPVTADDWVAGLQHMCDTHGGLEYLLQGVVVNFSEYINGECSFEDVGVKAIDDHTLEYTLTGRTPYFDTMLGYSIFAPLCRSYYESLGGKFGDDYSAEDTNITYGTTPETIAYCGPYLVSNYTAGNTIVFSANPTYWNKDGINIHTITWKFNDGTDPTKAYNDAKAGDLNGCNLNASTLELARTETPDGGDASYFDTYSYVSSTTGTSFMGFYNLNRYAFKTAADGSCPSTQTVTQAQRTKAAMQNVHFRRAISFAFDRASYNAAAVGEELKLLSLRNSYTPGTFINLPAETTIDINGTPTTFPQGTAYGEIVQAQIDADGVPIKVWDADLASSDGFDGWYSPENAAAELELAISDLGIEISAENPIFIDLPYPGGVEIYANRANAWKQSVEASLGGAVIINLVDTTTPEGWNAVGYDTTYGYEANYDVYDDSGWGPDYGDPQTFLDTFLPDFEGYMAKCCGLF